jgi:hypothetical protein
MAADDFWLRLYGLSDDLHPLSDADWRHTLDLLVAEYRKLPLPTREALRGHVAILIARLNELLLQMS